MALLFFVVQPFVHLRLNQNIKGLNFLRYHNTISQFRSDLYFGQKHQLWQVRFL